jgi:ribosomal protein S18 acetylase RimI-like enzyme
MTNTKRSNLKFWQYRKRFPLLHERRIILVESHGLGFVFCDIMIDNSYATIYNVNVHAHARREGIANAMLDEMENILRKEGVFKVILYVELGWKREWYIRRGYAQTGTNEDNIADMEKQLFDYGKHL